MSPVGIPQSRSVENRMMGVETRVEAFCAFAGQYSRDGVSKFAYAVSRATFDCGDKGLLLPCHVKAAKPSG